MKIDIFKYFLIIFLVVIVYLLTAVINYYPKDINNWLQVVIPDFNYSSIYSREKAKLLSLSTAFIQPGWRKKIILSFGGQPIVADSHKNIEKRLIDNDNNLLYKIVTSVKLWMDKLSNSLKRLKNLFSSLVIGYIPDPIAGLLLGMIFGGKSNLPKDLEHFFEVTGMLHILSASGYNVGLIVGLAQQFWRRFCSLRLATFWILISLLLYVLLADATPSVVRAGLMLGLQILATQLFHRSAQAYWLLLLSALGMIFWSRDYLESLSFQLSVSACLGLILWSWALGRPEIYDLSVGETFFKPEQYFLSSISSSLLKYLKDAVIMTFAAQSLSWAIQIVNFQTLSLVSLLANPAAIWLTPWLTTGGVFFILGALILNQSLLARTFLLPLLAWPLVFLSQVLLLLIQFFGQWESGVLLFSANQPRWFIPAWWLAIFLIALLFKRRRSICERAWYVT